jgi:hypothetical protein
MARTIGLKAITAAEARNSLGAEVLNGKDDLSVRVEAVGGLT